MLTRYPERFGALFCTIPLIDMRRYTKLLAAQAGSRNMAIPTNRRNGLAANLFGYHAAKPGRNIRRHDRHHAAGRTAFIPGTPARWPPSCRQWAIEAWFYEPAAGGHGYGKDNKERAAFTALGFTFLRDKIGWPETAA